MTIDRLLRKKSIMILSIIDMVLLIALIVAGIFKATTSLTTEYGTNNKLEVKAEEVSTEEVAFEEAVEKVAEETADAERGEATTAAVAAEGTTEEATVEEVANAESDEEKVEEYAYSNTITEEETASIVTFFEEAPDIDEDEYFDFVEEYREYLQDYALDPDGYLLIPLSEESLRQTDDERPLASVEMGLNTKPISDAVAFPFDLSEDQVKKVLAARLGQKVDFTKEEIKALRVELFLELAENPVLFESYMRLITEQKIGQYAKVLESWPSGARYMELMDIARDLEPYDGLDPYADIRGKGMNIWIRKVTMDGQTKNYTNPEYQKYVLDVVLLLLPQEADVEVLTAKAGDHYCLIPGEKNSLRFAQPANYKESLASLVFKIYTKDGRVAIKIGANLRDKRPEILNYTVTRKPVNTKKPDPPKQQPVVTTTTPSNSTPSNSNPGNPSNPNNPDNPNKPDNPPEGTKSPVDDIANAETDHKDDDPGSGTWKEDTGDSKSEVVKESQYEQGNSVNTDGANPSQYEPGPAADATDNGAVPDTAAPENQIGTGEGVSHDNYVDTNAGGTKVNTSTEAPATKMSSAPAVE